MLVYVLGLCAFLLGLCVEYNKDDNEKFDKQSLRAIIDKRIGNVFLLYDICICYMYICYSYMLYLYVYMLYLYVYMLYAISI